MTDKGRVLLVDDDVAVGTVLGAQLNQAGIETLSVTSAQEALGAMQRNLVDVVISDVRMPGMDGMQLLERLDQEWPQVPVIMLTAFGSVPLAVEAMKRGAYDFMLKPFDREEIVFCVKRAIQTGRHRDQTPPPSAPTAHLIGGSPAMNEVTELIQRAANSRATVLIRGESGTGKDVAARAIHRQSPRRDGPFIKIHCAALPDTLLESELFGYEKGAFTGATSSKPGRAELADGGTLFLDEIGDTTPAIQVKLLRLLQDRQFERLGDHTTRTVDVRFVAATHQNLEVMIEDGQFREDFFYRLNVIPILMPPLRARPEELAELARHFFQQQRDINGRSELELEEDAVVALCDQDWPGNVRQLENFMERLVVLTDGPQVTAEDVQREHQRMSPSAEPPDPARPRASSRPPGWTPPPTPSSGSTPATAPSPRSTTLDESKRGTERRAIASALERSGDNRSAAARMLGISRRTLYNKLHELGLQ